MAGGTLRRAPHPCARHHALVARDARHRPGGRLRGAAGPAHPAGSRRERGIPVCVEGDRAGRRGGQAGRGQRHPQLRLPRRPGGRHGDRRIADDPVRLAPRVRHLRCAVDAVAAAVAQGLAAEGGHRPGRQRRAALLRADPAPARAVGGVGGAFRLQLQLLLHRLLAAVLPREGARVLARGDGDDRLLGVPAQCRQRARDGLGCRPLDPQRPQSNARLQEHHGG